VAALGAQPCCRAGLQGAQASAATVQPARREGIAGLCPGRAKEHGGFSVGKWRSSNLSVIARYWWFMFLWVAGA